MPPYSKSVQVKGFLSKELYQICEQEIDKLSPLATFGKIDLKKSPETCSMQVKASMFEATLQCEDGLMSLQGKLGLLAMPFKSKIDQSIDRWVEKRFKK